MEKNQQPVDTYPKGEQEQIHHLTKQSSQNQYDRSQEENSPQSQHHPTTNSPPSYAQSVPSIVNQQSTALAPAAPSILNQQYTALSTAAPSVANQQHIELAQQPLLVSKSYLLFYYNASKDQLCQGFEKGFDNISTYLLILNL